MAPCKVFVPCSVKPSEAAKVSKLDARGPSRLPKRPPEEPKTAQEGPPATPSFFQKLKTCHAHSTCSGLAGCWSRSWGVEKLTRASRHPRMFPGARKTERLPRRPNGTKRFQNHSRSFPYGSMRPAMGAKTLHEFPKPPWATKGPKRVF